MITLLVACSGPAPQEPADPPAVVVAPPETLARRISLDIRGVSPSLAEYDQILADPGALDAMIDDWLIDPRFADRIVALYGEIYLTRTEQFPYSAYDLHLADQVSFVRSLGEEPLRIVARVATEDLPYTDIVTADWTMADETLETAFPIDRPSGTGWMPSTYTDGRPAVGVLATNGLMWRYTSTASNANRKRANQVSRILLCADYLTRAIDFDRNVNLLDEGAVLDALGQNPACVSCHVSLDPLASYFYGYWWYQEDSSIEASIYHPDREQLWQDLTGVAPGYHGAPASSLADLGDQIAADPRFVECAVEQAFELLVRRPPTLDDFDALTGHREAFLDGGLTVRSLFRSILGGSGYRSDARRYVSPDLLASQVEGLTGYRWTYGGADMLATDALGVRTLSGGADGTAVTAVSDLPNATSALVQQRLAEGAVSHLLATDPGRLFTVDFTETPETDRDAMAEQLVDLHLAVLGQVVDPDGEQVAADLELWAQLHAVSDDPREAWGGLLYALLRDPDLVLY